MNFINHGMRRLNCFSCFVDFPLDEREGTPGRMEGIERMGKEKKTFSFDNLKQIASLGRGLKTSSDGEIHPIIRTDLAPTPRVKKAKSMGTELQSPLRFHADNMLIINSSFLSSRNKNEEDIIGQSEEVLGWSTSRFKLQDKLDKELTRQNTPLGAKGYLHNAQDRLRKRLERLNLTLDAMKGDGNCQFRAISHSLFGSEDFYEMVRKRSVAYLAEFRGDYENFLEDPNAFDDYLRNMSMDKTWGDEITLCCAANAFECLINVVTSESSNWYLQYWPKGNSPCSKELFLAYTFPLHYDAISGQGVVD